MTATKVFGLKSSSENFHLQTQVISFSKSSDFPLHHQCHTFSKVEHPAIISQTAAIKLSNSVSNR